MDGFKVANVRTVTRGSDVRTLRLTSVYRPSRNVVLEGTGGRPAGPSQTQTTQNRPAPAAEQPSPRATSAPTQPPSQAGATPAPKPTSAPSTAAPAPTTAPATVPSAPAPKPIIQPARQPGGAAPAIAPAQSVAPKPGGTPTSQR